MSSSIAATFYEKMKEVLIKYFLNKYIYSDVHA